VEDARPDRRRDPVSLTERDRLLLAFAAEHRMIRRTHVQALLGLSEGRASARLRALTRDGHLVKAQPFAYQQSCYQITRKGLDTIESTLPRPQGIDPRGFRHDVGLAWLWLAARAGTFGALRGIVSERTMRSRDGRAGPLEPRLGVRLIGEGPGGRERLHYPDLLLELSTGHAVAVELELTAKGRRRVEGVMAGYAGNRGIDAVLYLVEDERLGRHVQAAARRYGIANRVHVQPVRFGERTGMGGRGRSAERVVRRARPEAGR
jgi:hypothetical protein